MSSASPYYARMLAEHRTQLAWARDRVALPPPAAAAVTQVMSPLGSAAVTLGEQSASPITPAKPSTHPRG